jgi:hypothetical protein
VSNPNTLDLVVVVNGQPFTVASNIQAPLRVVVNKVLSDSGNAGQPPENWELRDSNGAILDLSRKVEEFTFAAGTKLFLNLKAGIGG